MTVYEIPTLALIVGLAAAATAAIYLGILGMSGQLYLVRRSACRHLTFSFTNMPRQTCPRCRHPLRLHPVHTLIHPDLFTKATMAHHNDRKRWGAIIQALLEVSVLFTGRPRFLLPRARTGNPLIGRR